MLDSYLQRRIRSFVCLMIGGIVVSPGSTATAGLLREAEQSTPPRQEFCDPAAYAAAHNTGLHPGIVLDNESIASCGDGVVANLTGRLRVLMVDDIDSGGSWTIHQLIREGHRPLRLLFDDEHMNAGLPSGSNISVSGNLVGQVFVVSDTAGVSSDSAQETIIGERRSVALMVNLIDAPQTYSAADVRGTMYTNQGPDGDPMNMRDLYAKSTYGLLQFEPDADGDGIADVFDSIFIDANSTDCLYDDWAARADEAAIANGIDLDLYHYKIYVFSEQVDCGWSGIASTGGRTWIRHIFPDLIAHELGHLLHMGHAAADANGDGVITGTEVYMDYYTMMGAVVGDGNQLNTPQRLGWMTAARPGSVQEAKQDGMYVIYPVGGDHEQTRALRFNGLNGDVYYASIRKHVLEWSGPEAAITNKLRLHRCPGGNCYLRPELLAGLRLNETYDNPAIDLQLRLLSWNGDRAIVDVGEYCIPQRPQVTVNPEKSMLCPGDLVSYEVTVGNQDGPNCPSVNFMVISSLFSWNVSDPTLWIFDNTDSIALAPGSSHTFAIPSYSVPLAHPTGDNGFRQLFNVEGSIVNAPVAESRYLVESNCVPDSDGDNFEDNVDNCPATANDQLDRDGDTIGDACDNCILTANADQHDSNLDGYGNACDADFDQNCIVNDVDLDIMKAFFFFAGKFDADLNGDGVVNTVDLGIMKSGFFLPPGPSGVSNDCGASNRDDLPVRSGTFP